jgi:hypothetical protein
MDLTRRKKNNDSPYSTSPLDVHHGTSSNWSKEAEEEVVSRCRYAVVGVFWQGANLFVQVQGKG